ncbi:cytochrome C1 heme lyase [Roridomyces roridus]|uniref:Holocytochrome c-type synthase n=1 Tax=Roridomyces roridus TaxID=1738132 RepID=A0AAD7BW51_9AGAR|nr:cytochrome C1 heme lyase [Roridomyces roridus]
MSSCPVDHSQSKDEKCPVDQPQRSMWSRLFSSSEPSTSTPASTLSTTREVSSIPKASDGNWVYPSESQFFAAMARKNHDPKAADMKTIVPIHNAVNERAWAEVMQWEAGRGGEACGGVKLVNFKGKPGEKSIRARWKMLLGYSPPFDRHDWVVDRCGVQMRYIIDFYTGRGQGTGPSFYLDVRPALDNWEGVKMRTQHFWGKIFGLAPQPVLKPPSRS